MGANEERDRERVVEALRQREAVLKYIISHLPHRIFWKDREGRFLGGNQNLVHDLGMSSEAELIGKTDYDMPFPREQADFFRRIDREVMESGLPILDLEEPQLRPDGMHTLSTSKVALRDEAGNVTGILGIFVDITERKQMEEALKRAKEAAEAAARAKSEFLTTMSHELRTPLTLILGPLELLLDRSRSPLPEAARGDLERIQRNAWRLYQLVSDVLDFSRLEAGEMPVTREPVDVAELLGQVVDDAAPVAAQRGLTIAIAARLPWREVMVDRRKFEKIALNLIGNALKLTPSGGRITVGLDALGERFELSVTDTGPGIPHDQQGLLFRRFQQLDGSTTRKHEGTGIGLALVKEFAVAMGGEAGVESEPGRGSRFFVRLPTERPAATDATRPRRRQPLLTPAPLSRQFAAPPQTFVVPAADPSRPLVLVADDNADLRAYLVDLLGADYRVVAVGDGRAALAAARALRPEVILSDVMMPEMDGLELVAALKADPTLRNIPVVLLTAQAGQGELIAGLESGADDYLAKPFGPAELRARVRAAQRLHRLFLDLEVEHARLRETQEQLVHAGKMAAVGTLVAGLAHELNNPLGIILMHTQSVLKRSGDSEAVERALRSIETQAQRSGRLINALLDFSRKKPPLREPVEASALVARVIELLAAHARRRDVTLSVDLDRPAGDDLPMLTVNVAEIESALLNVVTNAIDATAAGGSVSLCAATKVAGGRGIEFTVADTGIGIAPDVLPRIFDPFFTLKPVGQGTGLGLSIARNVVEAHGGRIGVDSAPGKGTTLRIWLPAGPPAERAEDRP